MEFAIQRPEKSSQDLPDSSRWTILKARFQLFCQNVPAIDRSHFTPHATTASIFRYLLRGSELLLERINSHLSSSKIRIEPQELENILTEIEHFCVPGFLLLYERHKFFTRCQGNDESVHSFIVDLLSLADNCCFEEHKKRYLSSRIVKGVRDEKLRQKLQSVDKVNLQQIIATCLNFASEDFGRCQGAKFGLQVKLSFNENCDSDSENVDTSSCNPLVNNNAAVRGNGDNLTHVHAESCDRNERSERKAVTSGSGLVTQPGRPKRNVKKVVRYGVSDVDVAEQKVSKDESSSETVICRVFKKDAVQGQSETGPKLNDVSSTFDGIDSPKQESVEMKRQEEYQESLLGTMYLSEDDVDLSSGVPENNVSSHSVGVNERQACLEVNKLESCISSASHPEDGGDSITCGPNLPLRRDLQKNAKHKCSECSSSYATRNLLKRHVQRTHSRKKVNKCDICGVNFLSSSHRTKHMRQEHPESLTFKCANCPMTFDSQRALDQHKVSHSKEEKVKCEDCDLTFRSMQEYNQHRRKEHRTSRYPCNICGVQFQYPSKLKLHAMSKHNATKPFMCEICGASFAEKSILINHKNIHTGEKRHECATCGRRFLLKTTLNNHVQTHLDHKPHTCNVCGVSFKLSYYLRNHMKIHSQNRERPHVCATCGAAFLKSYQLRNHERKHTGEKPYKCTICDMAFSQMSSMKKHVKRIHEGVKPADRFSCEFCGLSFTHSCKLKLHLMKHTGERPFVCSLCGASYRENHQLSKHMKIHSGQEPFKCPICGQKFLQRSHMEGHVRKHTGERPFSCPICSARFSLKGYLRDHMKTHDSNRERRYKCGVCGKAFTCSSHMRSHERLHSGEKPHRCHICNTRFTKRSSVLKHLKRTHGIHNPPALTTDHNQQLQILQPHQQQQQQHHQTLQPLQQTPVLNHSAPENLLDVIGNSSNSSFSITCGNTRVPLSSASVLQAPPLLFQLSGKPTAGSTGTLGLDTGANFHHHAELQPLTPLTSDPHRIQLQPTLSQPLEQLQQHLQQVPTAGSDLLHLQQLGQSADLHRQVVHSEMNSPNLHPQTHATYTLAT
ncbi:zinc finger protein 16 [Aplysia californica]|uniref:Zinc finger protein 16 n=1 Tax=Aplysia californica TaxID=6500 RepID=A0ABM0JJ70_APLCA|nr:zinc finger protein 16 [Aplysia californica]